MKSYTGILKELGQAQIRRMPTYSLFVYSYIEIGDRTIGKLGCCGGLDGKLQHELGKEITLHVKDGYVEAIQSSTGQIYSSTGSNRSVILLVAGVLIGFAIIMGNLNSKSGTFFTSLGGLLLGALILFLTYRIYIFADKIENPGANMPNAIRIPKV
jgi:hypothetical protein